MCSRILLFIFSLQVKVILKGKFPSYNYAHPKEFQSDIWLLKEALNNKVLRGLFSEYNFTVLVLDQLPVYIGVIMIIKGLFGQRFIEKLYILGNNKLKLKTSIQ